MARNFYPTQPGRRRQRKFAASEADFLLPADLCRALRTRTTAGVLRVSGVSDRRETFPQGKLRCRSGRVRPCRSTMPFDHAVRPCRRGRGRSWSGRLASPESQQIHGIEMLASLRHHCVVSRDVSMIDPVIITGGGDRQVCWATHSRLLAPPCRFILRSLAYQPCDAVEVGVGTEVDDHLAGLAGFQLDLHLQAECVPKLLLQ
jgi:hypothetical protein